MHTACFVYSLGAHLVPVKEGTFYCAMKHAVGALLEGVRLELLSTRSMIRVAVRRPHNIRL